MSVAVNKRVLRATGRWTLATAMAVAAVGLTVVGGEAAGAADSTYTYEVSPQQEIGFHPIGVAVDPTTHTGYVALSSYFSLNISKIDMNTGAEIGGLSSDLGEFTNALAIDPPTHTLWATNALGVVAFDLTDDTGTDSFPTGSEGGAAEIAVDTVAHKVYFTVSEQNTVTVIDEATRSITKVIDVGFEPSSLAVDSDTHKIYATNYGGGSVTVIDGPSGAVTGTIPVGAGPLGLAVDPFTHTLVVGNAVADSVSFIDLTGAKPTVTAPAANGGNLAIDPTTGTIYAIDGGPQKVTVIDEPTRNVTASLGVGEDPAGIGVDPTRHTVLVSDLTGSADPSEGGTGYISFIRQSRTSTPQVDRTSVGFQAKPVSAISTGAVSTSGSRELLLALVQADGPADGKQKVTSVFGGGLTWTRAAAVNASGQGASEVWQAFAPAKVSNIRVTAKFATPADGAIVVKSYTGAAPTVGASASASAKGSSARVDVAPQSAGSLIVAGGLDWSSATRPVPAPGQTVPNYFADRRVGDEYWAQAVSQATTTAATPVSVQAKVPSGSRWSLAAVEVRPASTGGDT